jgi:hypothetical protein
MKKSNGLYRRPARRDRVVVRKPVGGDGATVAALIVRSLPDAYRYPPTAA